MAFEIYEIEAGGGWLALGELPGLGGALDEDLSRISEWGATMVLSLTQSDEVRALGIDLPNESQNTQNIAWRQFPIEDYCVPEGATSQSWAALSLQIRDLLQQGCRIFVHCRGGCGRSGMVILRLLVELGELPEVALERLRAVRFCAVETEAQLAWASHK